MSDISARSQQPRFNTAVNPNEFFARLIQIFSDEDPLPPYEKDSRKLDKWLMKFVKTEPHLNGVLSSVTAIDKNRGWSVTGGRNQVRRITDMLHNFEAAPGLVGWRPGFGFASKSFWSTNMGSVVELGRRGAGGPLGKLFTVDPSRCVLVGDPVLPLKYYPPHGKVQKWDVDDYFRIASNVDLDEEFNGLGECAVYRAVGIAQIMVALMRHNSESLLARAPRGLLLLSGIREDQWDAAMAARDAELDADEVKYFGALAVLASAATSVDAKLLALSQLPQAFNLKDWMDMTMYGYSLCFGYDPSEFWPVQYGALGRGNETQIQHEKATGKGRLDFVLGFQEQLQRFLPPTVDYAVEQRDDQGDLLHASVLQAWVNVAKTMYEATDVSGLPLITNEEARVLLAEFGVIPSTWSPTADVHSTDTDDAEDDPVVDQPSDATGTGGRTTTPPGEGVAKNPVAASPTAQEIRYNFLPPYRAKIREALLSSPRVYLAAERFPDEPIMRYEYSKEFPRGRMFEMWESGADLLKPIYHPSVAVPSLEQRSAPSSSIQPYHAPEEEMKVIFINPNEIIAEENEQIQRAAGQIVFSPIINIPAPEVFIDNIIQMPNEPRIETVTVERGLDGKIKSATKKVVRGE